jgi:DNA invertase Pin-like site-specific DNA recombinase
MPGRRLPEEKIAAIKAMRANGHSISEIVTATGAVRSCVSRHCQGIELPNGPLKRGPKRTLRRAICLKLKAEGLSIREIAARLGKGSTTVHRILNARSAA